MNPNIKNVNIQVNIGQNMENQQEIYTFGAKNMKGIKINRKRKVG